MAITFVATTQRNSTSNNLLTITKPSYTAQDDLLVMLIVIEDSPFISVTVPSGWQLLFVSQAVMDEGGLSFYNHTQFCYYKIAGPSEPANYTWTFGGNIRYSSQCITLRGIDTTTPIGNYSISSTEENPGTIGRNITAPSVTIQSNNNFLIYFGSIMYGGLGWQSFPGGYSYINAISQSGNGSGEVSAAVSGKLANTGESGEATGLTFSGTDVVWIASHIEIKQLLSESTNKTMLIPMFIF